MNEQKIEETVHKLFNSKTDNYIFIYTPPKVGSTTLVTSLRISLGKSYNIVHIHDEIMLSVLTGIHDIKINDIIHFLSNNGKKVYVIDVYRPPIERKMSEYFEKLSPYHFNNTEEQLNKYTLKRIVARFNKLFPHLENGDHYFEKYNIPNPSLFDFDKKYTIQEINRIHYIKLRLCDSALWTSILSSIFATDIVIIHDYKTDDKGLGHLYKRFKNEYILPANYIELVKQCKYFNFYYNEVERNNYLQMWSQTLDAPFMPYSVAEYSFYMNLCLENQHIPDIQIDHYIDNGCFCQYCTNKRKDIFFRAKAGEQHFDKIIHTEVIQQVKSEKINLISKKIKTFIHGELSKQKFKSRQFKINVTNT